MTYWSIVRFIASRQVGQQELMSPYLTGQMLDKHAPRNEFQRTPMNPNEHKNPFTSIKTAFLNAPGGTRTPDSRIRNPVQNAVSPCKQRTPKSDWEETGQSQNSISLEDSELAKLIEGWSKLSDDKKKAIIKMTS